MVICAVVYVMLYAGKLRVGSFYYTAKTNVRYGDWSLVPVLTKFAGCTS